MLFAIVSYIKFTRSVNVISVFVSSKLMFPFLTLCLRFVMLRNEEVNLAEDRKGLE